MCVEGEIPYKCYTRRKKGSVDREQVIEHDSEKESEKKNVRETDRHRQTRRHTDTHTYTHIHAHTQPARARDRERV